MYKYPILFFKGFVIGVAKIIPGISGSLIALNMGLYEKGIDAISNFFKDVKNNLIFLGTVGLGIVLAIVLTSRLINYLLLNHYFYVMMIFVGLIVGAIPNLKKMVNIKSKKEFIIFLVTFLLMIIVMLFKQNNSYIFKLDIMNSLYVVLIGFIDAATMIIPGISGTVVFMLMGCYQFFLSIFISLDSLNSVIDNITIIFLFFTGLFIGIIIITKIMNYLLNNKKEIIYPVIFGVSISSLLILLFETLNKTSSIIELCIGLLLLYISYYISKRIEVS